MTTHFFDIDHLKTKVQINQKISDIEWAIRTGKYEELECRKVIARLEAKLGSIEMKEKGG